MAEQPVIPIICGPTGSGKTAAALTLAGKYPIEIISADSRQVIKHLDIGTAKPTPQEQAAVRFHLIDCIEPGERYSAYRFLVDAEAAIGEIRARGNRPLVVGGTGLYLHALSEGVVEMREDPEGSVRKRLEEELRRVGAKAMHDRLAAIDPHEAERIHPNNSVRVVRALEIYELTGVSKSSLVVSGSYKKSAFRYASYCLVPPREALYAAIEERVDKMMQSGWLEELRQLIERGLADAVRRANVIGYQELMRHLDGELTLDEAVELIKRSTRRYAKRQMTWFRHRGDCRCFVNISDLVAAGGTDFENNIFDGQKA